MPELIEQPTSEPTRKVTMGALAGALATVFAGVSVASELPFLVRLFSYPGMEGAFATIAFFAVAYYVKERA